MANPYYDRAVQAAEAAGVDPALFAALIKQESGWNPNAVSPDGATGLTQVMPDTARQPGFGVAPLSNPNDPDEQLRFGAQYFKAMLDRYDGDTERALAAYNWGAGNADDWDGDAASLPAETRGYIGNISNPDFLSIAGIINRSPESPNGTTGDAITEAMRIAQEKEEEEPEEPDYGGLVSAGLQAMETGDLSGLGAAYGAARPAGGGGLMENARTNWQANKSSMAGLGDMLRGFGGMA